MPSLEEQLTEILPEVLNSNPNESLNGTKLYKKVKDRLEGDYTEGSVRVTFTTMSQNPTSVIAKVPSGHGYYLRQSGDSTISSECASDDPSDPAQEGREWQKEEKFRSVFIRHAQQQNKFAKYIEHTRSKQKDAGINRWKYPDVVLVNWEVANIENGNYKIDPDLLRVKSSLGEQPFYLESIELKVGLSLSRFRESFFQCVSNSKWAHNACLAIANPISDKTLIDELGRLGASYDVSIVSYGLTDEELDEMPSATDLMEMKEDEFDERIGTKIDSRIVSSGKSRQVLDWDHIRDLRDLNSEIREMFEWIGYCLDKTTAYSFEKYRQLKEIEANPTS